MSRWAMFLLLVVGWQGAVAQGFGTQWICDPALDDTSQVWFRHTYVSRGRPVQAFVTVESTGFFDLFVNQRNVSMRVLIPYRRSFDNRPIAITYDISRFLQRDSNTIAVWYSPAWPHRNTRQLAVSYYGRLRNGTPFAFRAGEDWLCSKSNRWLTMAGGETIDGTRKCPKWNAADAPVIGWTNVAVVSLGDSTPITVQGADEEAEKVYKIQQQQSFDVVGDSVYYDFGKPFRGWIRVTLRGAKAGERISIDGLTYICNGEIDEQACQKFTIAVHRRVLICGDSDFRREQIQKVEAIEIAPEQRRSYFR